MPWQGGIFTRIYDWVQEAIDGLNIEAARVGGEDDNFAAGINACLTKDGTNSPTANLPMANRKHTGVASPSSRNEYLDMASYQDGTGVYGGVSTGTADAYVIELSPPITAYVQGMMLRFKAHLECNAGATININGVGARPLEVEQSVIVAGEIVADGMYGIMYDGTSFQLLASGGESSSSFIALHDTPSSYVDQATKLIAVNGDEDEVIFTPRFIGAAIECLEGTDEWSIAGNGGWGLIPMSSEIVDNIGMHESVTNPDRLTVPVGYAGLWEYNYVIAATRNGGISAASYMDALVRINNSTEISPMSRGRISSQGEYAGMAGSGVISLSEGDFINLMLTNRASNPAYNLHPAYPTTAWPAASYDKSGSLSLRFLGS